MLKKVKKRKKKKYNLKSRITSALRRIWFYSPQRREVSKAAKDTGNKCAICKEAKDKLEIDHVSPVVPLDGFDNWHDYIVRLFEGKLIAVCKDCHFAKSTIQREIRKKSKKKLTK